MKSSFRIFLTVQILATFSVQLFGGTTGKIAGFVKDAVSGDPLIGANVQVGGTSLGASADADGYYFIINIPPGNYTVTASYIGYAPFQQTEVRVQTDYTTDLNFSLQSTTMQIQEVRVVAERAPVQMDRTFAASNVEASDMAVMPITNINQVIEIQAGVVDGHFRGGRSGEVTYRVDGVSVTDAYDGSFGTEVNNSAIQELQVISGTFNAEYGQAMSGVVNIVTREGGENYHGKISAFGGDYVSTHKSIFFHINDVSPSAIQDYELSLSGPVPYTKNLSFFVNGRHNYDDGWLYGQERWALEHPIAITDSGPTGILTAGDGKIVPMNFDKRLYGEGKLTWRVTPKIKLGYTSIYYDRNYKDYDHDWAFVPEGDFYRFHKGRTQILHLNHVLSSNLFYNVNLADNFTSYRHYLYKDPLDPRYVNPLYQDINPSWTLKIGGTKLQHFYRFTDSHELSGDISWQATKLHFLKTGFEAKQHEVFYEDISAVYYGDPFDPTSTPDDPKPLLFYPSIPPVTDPAHDRYDHFPVEAAIYAQDKIEMSQLIVNIGLRLDYFDPDGKILSNPYDPNPYDPIGLEARSQTLEERLSYWFKDAKPKYQVSPRVGIAYPISDRGVLHFAYGHFFQRPRFEYLYTNPEFELDSRTETLFGNADLNPEKTVTYEFGLQQEIVQNLSIQVDIFARDIRDLTSSDEIVALQGGYKYYEYVNRDFGQVRGVTLSLDKRYANNFSLFVDYTYQVAQGNASDPQAAYNASKGNREPEKELVPLNWDRRHTLNATLNYFIANHWGFSLIGKLGSGLPYTPEYQGIRTSFENDGRKPAYWDVDLTAFKSFPLNWHGTKLTLEANILNLFDTKNENDVYKDTGRATYSQEELLAYEVPEINTLSEYWTRPDWYAQPRQVRVGLSFEF
jgi:hypothetical protein